MKGIAPSAAASTASVVGLAIVPARESLVAPEPATLLLAAAGLLLLAAFLRVRRKARGKRR